MPAGPLGPSLLVPSGPTPPASLFDRVFEVRPRLHVFGHIHEAAGITETAGITFLNASTRMGRGSGVTVELTAAG